MCGSLARERSRKIVTISVAARSISWSLQRVPVRVYADERRRKLLVKKEIANNLCDRMLACRPGPGFAIHPLINFVYGDQTYKQRGSTRRAERLEFIGADNLPVRIEREVLYMPTYTCA